MQMIDVHSHVTPIDFPAAPAAAVAGRWPCMKCQSARKATLLVGEKPFRELDDRSWDPARRIEDMDRDGVAVQVLSPMPELLSYWLDASPAALICDHANAQIAEMVAAHPTRFRGLGAARLQDVARAVEDLHRLKEIFGLSGVEIGSNINGKMLGDAEFLPFFEAAHALGLAVFVHALHPVAAAHLSASPSFTAFAGFPIDVAMAVSSILMAGVMDKFPSLRLGFSHGGGAVGAIVGRLDTGWEKTGGYDGQVTRPSEQMRRMFFDSNVYEPRYLGYLARDVAPGRIFVGTDYPYLIMQDDPGAFVGAAGLSADAERSLRSGAAAAYLDEPVSRLLP